MFDGNVRFGNGFQMVFKWNRISDGNKLFEVTCSVGEFSEHSMLAHWNWHEQRNDDYFGVKYLYKQQRSGWNLT